MTRILIVEDDKLDQKAITKVLDQQSDYHYTIASTLIEARAKLKETAFDLVLLDANLPDGSTMELFDDLSGTPFVITAGAGSEDYAIRAYKAGACDYLIKDINRFYLKLIPSTIEKALKQKELEKLKESFVGMVTHELRTPLVVIEIGLKNLLGDALGPLSPKQAETVEMNIQNAKHLGKLIDDLLDLSRLQSGRAEIERREVDLGHLIHEVIEKFQPPAKEGKPLVCTELSDKLPPLECDPYLISQVLTNLLSNAIRYVEDKIVVKSAAIKGADGALQFIETSVANDGPGIPSENLEKLFEKFVQLDRANRKTAYKGTGLGLAICKEIIERHKGKIWAESSKERGVEFHFTLPIR